MDLSYTATERGFDIAKFADLYSEQCSLQRSSLAREDAVWLGINEPQPRMLARDAIGAPADATGWVNIPVHKGVLIPGRMHLNREMARMLGEALLAFAETGELT